MRYLYKITNLVNGKIYIGQTDDFKERILKHIYNAKQGKTPVSAAIKKYGKENFKYELLCVRHDSFIDIAEVVAIKYYNSTVPFGYNLESGGCKNKKHNLLSKQKMRQAKLGKKMSDTAKENMRIARTGVKLSKAHVEAIRKTLYGRPVTEATRAKMSERSKAQKRNALTEEHKQKIREAQIGHTVTAETRKKLSKHRKGVAITEAHRQNIKKAMQKLKESGYKKPPMTEEHKKLFHASRKGKAPWNKGMKLINRKKGIAIQTKNPDTLI